MTLQFVAQHKVLDLRTWNLVWTYTYHKYTDNYIQNIVLKSTTKNMMRSFELTTTNSLSHCFKWQRNYFCKIISWTQKKKFQMTMLHLYQLWTPQAARMRPESQANQVMWYKMLLMWRWGQGVHLGLCKTHNYRIYNYTHIWGTMKTHIQALWYIRQSFASCSIT